MRPAAARRARYGGRKRPCVGRNRRRNARRPRSGQPHDSERGQQFEQHRSIWRPCAVYAPAYGAARHLAFGRLAPRLGGQRAPTGAALCAGAWGGVRPVSKG
jgi:hypothetical protein